MAELLDETQNLESTTIGIYRTAAVVKGGRRFSFGALVVVGDRRGNVGIGYAKAPGVPGAIEKAQKDARKHLVKVTLLEGTLPHPVTANFGASKVKLVPAAPGTGVIAGATVRAVLELAGVRDCLTKAYGSTNNKNLCQAALLGLQSMRSKAQVEQIRGVTINATVVEELLEAGRRYAPKVSQQPKPVARPAGPKAGGRGKGRKGGAPSENRGRGGGGVTVTNVPQQQKHTQAHAPAVEQAPVVESAPETPATGESEKQES